MKSKLFLFGLMITFKPVFADEAIAGRYDVIEYTWCNGPLSGPDASDCPSYASWGGVDLKRIRALELSISSAKRFIKLEDSNGQTWQADLLLTCNSQLSDQQGCRHKLDFSNQTKIQLSLNQWSPDEQLYLEIENQNKLSIHSLNHQSFFELTVKQSPL